MRRAAHRVGRSGCKAHHGEGDSGFSLHHRAVILGQEQGSVDATFGGRVAEGGHRFDSEVTQHGVEKRRVLPLKQADPS